jgi:hypothetical protein
MDSYIEFHKKNPTQRLPVDTRPQTDRRTEGGARSSHKESCLFHTERLKRRNTKSKLAEQARINKDNPPRIGFLLKECQKIPDFTLCGLRPR